MSAQRPWIRRLRAVASIVFLAIVALLLVRFAATVDKRQVADALAGYDVAVIVAAIALTVLSYLIYSGFELAARAYAHHDLPAPRVMAIAVISYAFSLNLGGLVGGAGVRYRLYAQAGLKLATISRAVLFALATNWLGYALLTGALFATRLVKMPPQWGWSGAGLQWLGVAMVAAIAAYVFACQRSRGRVFHLRGHHFRLPPVHLALVQLALSCANWAVMGALLYVLMPAGVDYATVLGALLLAAVASAITNIPAGIGVIEAVMLGLIGDEVPVPHLLAALLAYRAFYYLGPMLFAVAGYLVLEARKPRLARP